MPVDEEVGFVNLGPDCDDDFTDENYVSDYDRICKRLDTIEKDITEFKVIAGKVWGFIEQMKDNPMLSAMLGAPAVSRSSSRK